MKPRHIAIIDLDGTLCVVGDRRKYMEQFPQDWEAFYADSFDDQPIPAMCDLVLLLAGAYEIIFCTSRRESVRQKTQIWLQKQLGMTPQDYTLIMRSNSDRRLDVLSKVDTFTQTTTEEERTRVAFVVEDSPAMAVMWRHAGYRCLQFS